MKKKKVRKIFCCLLIISLCSYMFSFFATSRTQNVRAAGAEEVYKKKIIHMVYDNSRSMYWNGKENISRWCQAQYGMTVFARMMNFESGDILRIFPMHPIVVDGEKYGDDEEKNCKMSLDITSSNDIGKINRIQKTKRESGDTPFEVVKNAAKALEKNKGDKDSERWLLVFTDGEFNKDKWDDKKTWKKAHLENKRNPVEEMKKYADKYDMKVVFFSLAEADNNSDSDSENYHYISSNGEDITEGLIKACNTIFARDFIENFNDNKKEVDVSLKKIIILTQGNKDVAKVKYKGEELQGVGSELVHSLSATDNSKKLYRSKDGKVDDKLVGNLTTFEGKFDPGEYEFDVGKVDINKNCIVCYEADVKLKPILTNQNNQIVKIEKGVIPEGKYNIDAVLVDAKTGKIVKTTNKNVGDESDLLGELSVNWDNCGLDLDGNGELDSDEKVVTNDSVHSINLEKCAGKGGQLIIDAEYGNIVKYKVSTKGDDSWKFEVAQNLQMDVEKKQNRYEVNGLEDGDGLIVHLKINNRELTEEEIEAASITVKPKDTSKKIDYKVQKTEKGKWIIKFKYPKEGKSELDKGEHEFDIVAQFGKVEISQEESIDVFSWRDIVLNIIIIILIIIIFILLILYIRKIRNTKVGPTGIVAENIIRTYRNKTKSIRPNQPYINYRIVEPEIEKENIISLLTRFNARKYMITININDLPDECGRNKCSVTLKVEAMMKRKKKSNYRDLRVIVSEMHCNNVASLDIGGNTVEFNDSRRFTINGENYDADNYDDDLIISDGTTIGVTAEGIERRRNVGFDMDISFKKGE